MTRPNYSLCKLHGYRLSDIPGCGSRAMHTLLFPLPKSDPESDEVHVTSVKMAGEMKDEKRGIASVIL
jgi:hypothetical protein